jgi:Peptidase_C39 like family
MSPSPSDQRMLLAFFARSFAEDISLLAGDASGDVTLSADTPLAIHDINGEPLFLDFAILNAAAEQIGIIRSSARGEELPLIDSIALGPPYFDPSKAVAAALAQTPHDLPNSTIRSNSFVCYGYPHIGVLVQCTLSGQSWSLVYDATSPGTLVRKWQGSPSQSGSEAGPLAKPTDGLPFYSYLNQMRSAQPEGSVDAPLAAKSHWTAMRAAVADAQLPATQTNRLEARMMLPSSETTVATTAANPRVCIRGTLLPARTIGQETPVYCAVATVQMILDFLGISNLSQTQIAQALQTTDVGTTNENMIAGIPKLTQGRWTANVITLPTFEQNVNLMEALIPAKSGIPAHARLLRGWREYCHISLQGELLNRHQFYVINDPYPEGTGQLVLENAVTPMATFYTNSLGLVKATANQPVGNGGAEGGAGLPFRSSVGTETDPFLIRVRNSRTFEIQLPAGIRVVPAEPVPPDILELVAAYMRTSR